MTKKPRGMKSIAAGVPVPQSRDEAARAIGEIGRLQRERARIETAMNDEIAVIRERFEAAAQPLSVQIAAKRDGVALWCEANRQSLTQNGRTKTAQFPTGEVRWRVTPPKVAIRGVEAVLDALKRAGLRRFVREKEEVNKEAILAEPDAVIAIDGITIAQSEELVIEPFETELAETREVG